jgi:hypothetical protein
VLTANDEPLYGRPWVLKRKKTELFKTIFFYKFQQVDSIKYQKNHQLEILKEILA